MPFETLDEFRERIERTLREKSALKAAWPDLDLQALPPAERRKEVREREVFNARLSALSSGRTLLSKLAARGDDARGRRGKSVWAIGESARRKETDRAHGASEAWKLCEDWLRRDCAGGGVGGAPPAAAAAHRRRADQAGDRRGGAGRTTALRVGLLGHRDRCACHR
jgi:hypothetical protein